MAKTPAKSVEQSEETKTRKTPKEKKEKTKEKNHLIGRVKKVIKKTKRKLSEDKFEKELKRTIAFLEELQSRMAGTEQADAERKAVATPKAPARAAAGVNKPRRQTKTGRAKKAARPASS